MDNPAQGLLEVVVMSDCIEPYRECVRSRQERIRQACEAHPELSARKIADIAGVSDFAVRNYKEKMEIVISSDEVVEWSPERDQEKRIAAVIAAISRCPLEDRVYLWKHVFPRFKLPTRRAK